MSVFHLENKMFSKNILKGPQKIATGVITRKPALSTRDFEYNSTSMVFNRRAIALFSVNQKAK